MPISRSTTPYFAVSTEAATRLRENLPAISSTQLASLDQRSQIVPIERVIFGFSIPYLPNLVTSPHLAGTTEQDRLVEALEHQMQIVANLGKWNGMVFALRYLVQPERGEVKICLLVRLRHEIGRAKLLGEQVAMDLVATFQSLNIPLEPITELSELSQLLTPPSESVVLQLHQREDMVRLRTNNSLAYVVYPFRRPSSTWIQTFEAMLGQDAPCLISIHLEPTQLYDSERQSFSDVAALAENLANYRFFSLSGPYRLPDPQARAVALLHADYLHRLTSPSLLAIYIASPDKVTAYAVAHDLGAEITESVGIESMLREGDRLPCGFDLVAPENESDLRTAERHITELEIGGWGRNVVPDRHISPESIPQNKQRLRYLADLKAASAAFRFPIAIRGGIPGIKTQQAVPSYDVGPRQTAVAPGEILLGDFNDRGGVAGVPINLLTKHMLVAGTTGSGKTTTCFQILSQLWEQSIPFLVIEPTHNVYRTLLESPFGHGIRLFTLGDESLSPFRLNPMEIMPGVRVEAHLSALKSCLEAAIPTFGALPSLIEDSLHSIYANKGWNLTDKAIQNDQRLMPTLGDFYFALIQAVESRSYSDKTEQDIRGAATGRIRPLLLGSKGRMLNTSRSIPMGELMSRPTILELEALDNDDEKALIMLFLLTMIREYCRVNNKREAGLQHVTLIEEAHRVMRATSHSANREISADTRAVAVDIISASLSEVRALGEGIIIAEQVPNRLAEDALKNTNTKIVHRLLGQDDRQTVGATMNLGQEQEPYLAKLQPGQAALFIEGYERPTFISVPDYRRLHKLPQHVDDDRLSLHMATFRAQHADLALPFAGCQHCLRQCHYRDQIGRVAYEIGSGKSFRKGLYTFEAKSSSGDEESAWIELAGTCQEVLRPIRLADDRHAVYCYFVHVWDYETTDTTAKRFRQAVKGKNNDTE